MFLVIIMQENMEIASPGKKNTGSQNPASNMLQGWKKKRPLMH